ncbi:MAG: carboxypeptidase-like regulatory domain-containing protein [Verrucomicrobiota bacterium]
MRATFFLFLLCLATMNAQPAPEAETGLKGVINISPVHGGPSRPGDAGGSPLADITFVVKDDQGKEKTFTTDAQGRFQISLAPGQYQVMRQGVCNAIGFYGPFKATVAPGRITAVEWKCDSGMR